MSQDNSFCTITTNQVSIHGDVSLPQHIATKYYVDQKIDSLISGAPETLDTLREIVDFIGDENTSITIMSRLLGVETSREAISQILETEINNIEGRTSQLSQSLTTDIVNTSNSLVNISREMNNKISDVNTRIAELSSLIANMFRRVF